MDFEIGFSNKVHIIIEHIPQVIERTGRSLHLSSAQVVEAAHAKFDKVWQRYKVNDLERDFHGEKLRNCVVDFNTKNLYTIKLNKLWIILNLSTIFSRRVP